jgi:HEPN domain-containing protein
MTLQELLNQWFSIATDDFTVAKRCYKDFYPKQLAIACYHCQQASEKALKGFLTYRDIEPPKIHNLVKLCGLCIEQDAAFNEILEVCDNVNQYSTITRYPDEMVINEAMTRKAIDQAQAILAFCMEKVPLVSNGAV